MEAKSKDCRCQGRALTALAASLTATRNRAAQNAAFHAAHALAAGIKNDGPGQTKERTQALCEILLFALQIKEL